MGEGGALLCTLWCRGAGCCRHPLFPHTPSPPLLDALSWAAVTPRRWLLPSRRSRNMATMRLTSTAAAQGVGGVELCGGDGERTVGFGEHSDIFVAT